MNYQIANSSILVHQVGANKKVNVTASKILRNVTTIVQLNDQAESYGYIKKNKNTIALPDFTQGGRLSFMTFFKPSFSPVDNPQNKYVVFDFGEGDGKSTIDVPSDMAASLLFTFSPDSAPASPIDPVIATQVPRALLAGDIHQRTILDFTHKGFGNIPSLNKSCTISINQNVSYFAMMQQSVEVHIFDREGNLMYFLDYSSRDKKVVVDYLSTGIQIACLVKGSSSPLDQNGEELKYAIGDPKTDAKIIVTEVDI